MVQKQRREARKREREAREAAEEEQKQKLIEIEASESAKKIKEAQNVSLKTTNECKDEMMIDDSAKDMEAKVVRTISMSSSISIDSLSNKSEISDRSEPIKTRLKLADGNVQKASVITEGVNSQKYTRSKTDTNLSQNNLSSETAISLPWQDPNTKTGFSWTKYLEATRSKIAPSKIFDETSRFPHSTNRFKVGMKLEAIDPEHPALFCVVTVVSIKGCISLNF